MLNKIRYFLLGQRLTAGFLIILILVIGVINGLGHQSELIASYKTWRQGNHEFSLDDLKKDGIRKYYFNRISFSGTTDYREQFTEGVNDGNSYLYGGYYYYVLGDQGYVVMIYTNKHPVIEGYEYAFWEGMVRRTPPKIVSWAQEDKKNFQSTGLNFEPEFYIDLDETAPGSDFLFAQLKFFGILMVIILFLEIPFTISNKEKFE